MQLHENQSLFEEHKEKFSKLIEQKQNTDENCDMFIELQQKLQKKLDYVNRRLLEEKSKFQESEKEKTKIQQQLEKITEERNQYKKELETEKNKSLMVRLLKG
jgi:hypothetical protein